MTSPRGCPAAGLRGGCNLAAYTSYPLAPPGRMALTTYLSATAICIAVFYGVGLGWMWSLGQTQCLLFAFALFGVLALASRLWLERFRFGPVEWAWRCATYGARLPLRR